MSPTTRTPRDVGTTLSRNKIMDVAERLMAQNGYAATSIAAICTQSGLPVGSVYHHFGSKTGLLQQVLLRGRDRLFAAFPPPAPGPPRDRLISHYGHAVRAVADNLPFFRIESGLLVHASLEPEIHVLLAEMYLGGLERATVLFTSIAADAGVVDPEGVGRRIATTTISFSRGVATQFGMTPQRRAGAFADLADLMWNLIADSRGGGPSTDRRPAVPERPTPARPAVSARVIAAGSGTTARDSRVRFLDVAERLMADCGYTAASVADICARTGRPVGSFYHHFSSKFGLLQTILDRGSSRFRAALPDVEHDHGSPRDRLYSVYEGAAAAVIDNLDYFRILFGLQTQTSEDSQIYAWVTQLRVRGNGRVIAVLQEISSAAGVPDATEFGERLSLTSLILTDGAICGFDVEDRGLREDFADIAELVWSAIARRVALTPRS